MAVEVGERRPGAWVLLAGTRMMLWVPGEGDPGAGADAGAALAGPRLAFFFFFPAVPKEEGLCVPCLCHPQHRGSATPRGGSAVKPGPGGRTDGRTGRDTRGQRQPSGREALCSTWVQESSWSWPPSSPPLRRCLSGSGTAAPRCLLAPLLRHVSSAEHPAGGRAGGRPSQGSVTPAAASLLSLSEGSHRLGLGTFTSPLLPAALPLVWLWTSPAPGGRPSRGLSCGFPTWPGTPLSPMAAPGLQPRSGPSLRDAPVGAGGWGGEEPFINRTEPAGWSICLKSRGKGEPPPARCTGT